VADDVCVIRSMKTDQFNHAPGQIFMNTGSAQPGRPSMGSWVTYGLGAETQDLPAFVVMSTGNGISGGAANWSSGFPPDRHTGVRFRNGRRPDPERLRPPRRRPPPAAGHARPRVEAEPPPMAADGDPEIATRIASYEMAYRLQTSAPDLTGPESESQATLDLYGCKPDEPSFAGRACSPGGWSSGACGS
jgi:hypothetical protein